MILPSSFRSSPAWSTSEEGEEGMLLSKGIFLVSRHRDKRSAAALLPFRLLPDCKKSAGFSALRDESGVSATLPGEGYFFRRAVPRHPPAWLKPHRRLLPRGEGKTQLARQPFDLGAAAAELFLEALKAAIEMIDAVDQGLALGGERGDDE